jgi:hypothetical protein
MPLSFPAGGRLNFFAAMLIIALSILLFRFIAH